ncbi:acylase [Gammaproteobacteria bacterium LSUCC0112]|nr:acylase [Gammaproteobacteria bacterium LSUCC0112]
MTGTLRGALLLPLALATLITCAPQQDNSSVSIEQAEIEISAESQRLNKIAQRVEIVRDDFGVAHIYAETDADAVFGFLYAQAEDDFPRIERNYTWAIGRLAEVEGESALYSDLRAKLYMSEDEAKAAYDAAPEWLRALCDAFADGLNFYLASNPHVQPKLLTRFENWMPFYFFEGSIGGDIEAIPTAGIEALYSQADARVSALPLASTVDLTAQPVIAQLPPAPLADTIFDEPAGSNGIAINGEMSASGNALLLINPHTSFFFRGEYHLVSDEGLNAYGAATWGQFFIYQGFNETTGWMHTSTFADFMDEFVHQVVNDNGELKYRFGDELRPIEISEVTLRYRTNVAEGTDNSAAQYAERTFPIYRTHQGPITHMQDDQWVVTRINWNPVDALRQSYQRMKTANYDEFREMMDIRTNSSNNTVFADAEGNIAYFHGNFMPRRDPQFDYSQPVDGSNPATDWQGVHEVEETVMIVNPPNGWIQNSNATPFTVSGEYSPNPDNYPRYMAPDAENFRQLNSVELLSSTSGLNINSLLDLAYDPTLKAFEQLIPGLVSAWEELEPDWPDLEQPIEALRGWNFDVSTDSVAMTLAHFYGMNAAQQIDTPAGMTQLEQINWLGTDASAVDKLRVFSETIVQLNESFGTWNTPWGDVNRFQRITGDINHPYSDNAPSLAVGMASSRWGALASFGARAFPGTNRIYGNSGNSFVAVVEFGDKVEAISILAGGQSSDPASPHFDDQAQRYVEREFKTVAFYPEDVNARAQRRYHPGE